MATVAVDTPPSPPASEPEFPDSTTLKSAPAPLKLEVATDDAEDNILTPTQMEPTPRSSVELPKTHKRVDTIDMITTDQAPPTLKRGSFPIAPIVTSSNSTSNGPPSPTSLRDRLNKLTGTPRAAAPKSPIRPSEMYDTARTKGTRLNTNTEKFKMYARFIGKLGVQAREMGSADRELLKKLEEENNKLAPQDSTSFLLARLERQNQLLDEDPRSISIQSNKLKADFATIQKLIMSNSSSTETDGAFTTGSDGMPNGPENIDWEFWSALIESFPTIALKTPALLAHKIRRGIPSPLRGLIWQAMSQSSATNLESLYPRLLEEKSPYEKTIQRDLARTFPGLEMFREEGGEGQAQLERVLRAYSVYDAFVGYCQGLGFLVGPLLMNMNEQQAFCVFVRLMETYDMRTMFTLNMEGLQLRLYQFQALLTQLMPSLSAHLTTYSVHPAMYASQWFLTLFAYTYPMPLVLRIYDLVFAEGAPETIMRVAIALIRKNEEKLLAMTEFEDILDTLTNRLFDAFSGQPNRVINEAMTLSQVITKEKLDRLADSYVKEVEAEKKRAEEVMAVRFGFFSGKSGKRHTKGRSKGSISSITSITSANLDEVSGWKLEAQSGASSRSTSPADDAPAKKDNSAMLHQQIEDLVSALSQLQKDHLQATQEVVSMKMDRMDLENERESLRRRLQEIERKEQKFKQKRRDTREKKRQSMAKLASLTGDFKPTYSSRLSMDSNPFSDSPLSPTISESVESRFDEDETMSTVSAPNTVEEEELLDFVNSIRASGDFGALVASGLFESFGSIETGSVLGAASTEPSKVENTRNSLNLTIDTKKVEEVKAKDDDLSDDDDDDVVVNENLVEFITQSQQDVTGELVEAKLHTFELQQQLERLSRELGQYNDKLEVSKAAQREIMEKNASLQEKIEKLEGEKAKIESERNEMMKDYKPLRHRVVEAKKVAMELQLEKLTMVRDLDRLTNKVRELEGEKKVWTAMKEGTLQKVLEEEPVKPAEKDNRRHTVQAFNRRATSFFGGSGGTDLLKEYQAKYHEAETRCRELERMLADTKLRVVELETSADRPSSLQCMPLSPTSSTATGITISGQSDYYRRLSMESSVSAVSDIGPITAASAKRSSMYGAMWGAINNIKVPRSYVSSPITTSSIDESIPIVASPKSVLAERHTHQRSSSVGTWLGRTST